MANENLPANKQKELQEGGLVGSLDSFVDWVASMIEEMGGDPENPKDVANFITNPHMEAGFGEQEGGRIKLPSNIPSIANPDANFWGTGGSQAQTFPAPPQGGITPLASGIGAPMHEAMGDYTKAGEFRFHTSPTENAGETRTRQVGDETLTTPPSSLYPKVDQNVASPGAKTDAKKVAPTGTQEKRTPSKKEAGKEGEGEGVKSPESKQNEAAALRGLAELLVGSPQVPYPGLPSGAGSSNVGSPVGGVATPMQPLNPFGSIRRF